MRAVLDPNVGDEIISALLESRIARGGIHQADGGEMMTGDVAGQLTAIGIPAGVALGLGGKSGTLPVEYPCRRRIIIIARL